MLRDRSLRIGPSQRRSPALLTALLLLALLLLTLDRAGMLGNVRAQITSLISPALTLTHSVGLAANDALGRFGAMPPAEAEVAALRAENSSLKAAILRTQQLELEVARLRQQLRIEKEKPWRLLGGNVSAFVLDTGRRQILLSVGAQNGVRPGMAVIAQEGSNPPALVGVVSEVGPQSASVLLITDFSSAITARIYRSDRTIDGVVQGQWQRGSRLRLQEIARDALIASGDTVVTAGLSSAFSIGLPNAAIPPNIPIGTIEQAGLVGQYQEAELRPFVDPDRVRYAWVILSDAG
jgi:rod shape-determining protein MreC